MKLFSAIRLSRAALPGMKARKWGRIINVLNTGAKWPRLGSAPTSVTRVAGMALTKVLSSEGAEHNVLVTPCSSASFRPTSGSAVTPRKTRDAPTTNIYRGDGQASSDGPCGYHRGIRQYGPVLAPDAGTFNTGTAVNVDGSMCPVV